MTGLPPNWPTTTSCPRPPVGAAGWPPPCPRCCACEYPKSNSIRPTAVPEMTRIFFTSILLKPDNLDLPGLCRPQQRDGSLELADAITSRWLQARRPHFQNLARRVRGMMTPVLGSRDERIRADLDGHLTRYDA